MKKVYSLILLTGSKRAQDAGRYICLVSCVKLVGAEMDLSRTMQVLPVVVLKMVISRTISYHMAPW